MAESPFYHTRPNKHIDRHLFIQSLTALHRVLSIQQYQYIGFGSIMFDDFKMLHNQLGIEKMFSLEMEELLYKRAEFNTPYNCITVLKEKSTSFIAEFERDSPTIAWLDYTKPGEIGGQFSDFCCLLSKMESNDIVRITLNANPTALDTEPPDKRKTPEAVRRDRFDNLQKRIGDYIPELACSEDVCTMKYPVLLLSCLEKAAKRTIIQTKYDKREIVPIFSSCYKDGTQMVTLTVIVLKDGIKAHPEVVNALANFKHFNFLWNKPCNINVPELTPKEILELNKLLPPPCNSSECWNECSLSLIAKEFKFIFNGTTTIQSYLDYYKYYPNFHHISM